MKKEIKISGEVKNIIEGENRAVFLDCGGIVFIRDYILKDCGGYNIGDRVTISIISCDKNEYYYPPKPTDKYLKFPK